MPTKKTRLGFIPRTEVLDLINKLSFEYNLSYSKIINILVEEALYKRGMLKSLPGNVYKESDKVIDNLNQKNVDNVNVGFNNNFKNNLAKDETLSNKLEREDSLDKEIYDKFLMFLQFQEMMKKREL